MNNDLDDIEELKTLAIKAIEAAEHCRATSVPCTGWFNWTPDPDESVERTQFNKKATPEIVLRLITMLERSDSN